MKKALHAILHRAGFQLNRFPFHSLDYLRHTARRLEHLASLGIPVRGLSVLEVGAGVGDFSHYYLDRGCRLTMTEPRAANLRFLRRRYPGADIRFLDLERPTPLADGPFDIVHCYGVLYHLGTPAEALGFLSDNCRHMLFLETRVAYGDEPDVQLVCEDPGVPSLATSGTGCRPTRRWLFDELSRRFECVYLPRTQPNHTDFPLDWRQSDEGRDPARAIFVASRTELDNPLLCPELLSVQEHQI